MLRTVYHGNVFFTGLLQNIKKLKARYVLSWASMLRGPLKWTQPIQPSHANVFTLSSISKIQNKQRDSDNGIQT